MPYSTSKVYKKHVLCTKSSITYNMTMHHIRQYKRIYYTICTVRTKKTPAPDTWVQILLYKVVQILLGRLHLSDSYCNKISNFISTSARKSSMSLPGYSFYRIIECISWKKVHPFIRSFSHASSNHFSQVSSIFFSYPDARPHT